MYLRLPCVRRLVSHLTKASAFVGFAMGAAHLVSAAQSPVATDPVIELPKIVVTDSRELPPPEEWRYAEIPGFEILTNASDSETQKLLRDFQYYNIGIDVAWKGLQEKRVVPISLIICGKGGKFSAFEPKNETQTENSRASLFLRDRELAAIVLDFEAKTINPTAADALANASAAPAPAADDAEAAPDTGAAGMEVDHYQQLYREYLRFLMNRIEPRLPVWFEEGLAQLFTGMKVDPTRIIFGKLDEPDADVVVEGDFKKALQRRGFVPLDQFFAVAHDAPVASRPLGSVWAKQAQGLVHLWLFGENRKYQQSFITFLTRLQKEPPSEKLFEECFKMNYAKMLGIFRGYLEFTAYQSLEWRLPKGQKLPEPAPLVLRDATLSEIGRIKGDALRLAGNVDTAHKELVAPYIRGERDPRLIASLGLEELAAGREDRGKKFLEAAAAAKVERPRAYLELARLNSKTHLAQPAGADGLLSAAQAQEVVAPLLVAARQPPPMHEVYELLADTLVRSVVVPPRETLAVLYDGANRFPKRLGITYQTAVLSIRAGELKGAAGLIERGLLIAPEGRVKVLFRELKATLPATSATPALAPTATKP